MAKRSNSLERRTGERAKRYTPREHPEVTAALEAAGLKSETVYRLRRWDRGTIDLDRLGAALHGLTVDGWRVSSAAGSVLRYPAAFKPARPGADPIRDRDARAAELRLAHERAKGLAYVFDRSPEAIEIHLARHRGVIAALAADPIKRLQTAPGCIGFFTPGELGALSGFVSAFGRFHAAIGNAAYTVSAGEGVPMTDEARQAAQEAYLGACAVIIRHAGPRALSACQDLAANRSAPDRWRLKAAAQVLDTPAAGPELVRYARAKA